MGQTGHLRLCTLSLAIVAADAVTADPRRRLAQLPFFPLMAGEMHNANCYRLTLMSTATGYE